MITRGVDASGFDHTRINEAVATGTPVPLITRALSDDDVFGGFIQTPYAFGFFGHLMPTGSTILDGTLIPHGSPGDPDFAAIHGTYPPDFVDVVDPAIEARVGAIGPAPNPANNRLLALQHYKGLAPITDTLNSPNADTQHAMATLIERLGGAIIAGHSGGAGETNATARELKARGKLQFLKGMIQFEGSCSLAGLTPQDLDHVPYLAFIGDYFEASLGLPPVGCYETVAALNASPTRTASPAAVIELDDPRFRGKFNGATNMMMLGRKSNEAFDVLADWVAKNVSKPKKNPHACARKDHDDDDDDHHHH